MNKWVWSIGVIIVTEENRSTRKTTCPTAILSIARVSAVRGRRLTTWARAQPESLLFLRMNSDIFHERPFSEWTLLFMSFMFPVRYELSFCMYVIQVSFQFCPQSMSFHQYSSSSTCCSDQDKGTKPGNLKKPYSFGNWGHWIEKYFHLAFRFKGILALSVAQSA